MGFYDFFPVNGDFEILRFFFAVCGAPVSVDFEILRFFLPVCAAPVLETLKIFKKNPQYGKIPGVGI